MITLDTNHAAVVTYQRPTTAGRILVRTAVILAAAAAVYLGTDRQPAYTPAPQDSPISVAVTHICGDQIC